MWGLPSPTALVGLHCLSDPYQKVHEAKEELQRKPPDETQGV